jgi:hypothetical protein
MLVDHPIDFFYCPPVAPEVSVAPMQTAFVKTSISIPADLFSFLKEKAEANGGTPISRLVAQAIRQQVQKEKTKGGKK